MMGGHGGGAIPSHHPMGHQSQQSSRQPQPIPGTVLQSYNLHDIVHVQNVHVCTLTVHVHTCMSSIHASPLLTVFLSFPSSIRLSLSLCLSLSLALSLSEYILNLQCQHSKPIAPPLHTNLPTTNHINTILHSQLSRNTNSRHGNSSHNNNSSSQL